MLHKPAYISSSDKNMVIITITLHERSLVKNVLLKSLLEAFLTNNLYPANVENMVSS